MASVNDALKGLIMGIGQKCPKTQPLSYYQGKMPVNQWLGVNASGGEDHVYHKGQPGLLQACDRRHVSGD
jgi:hypothetical protein